MRVANGWKQYRILDTSQLEKLENWHGVTLVRPDPQIIWKTPKSTPHGTGRTDIIAARPPAAEAGRFQEAAAVLGNGI